jgi:hypothetical protein
MRANPPPNSRDWRSVLWYPQLTRGIPGRESVNVTRMRVCIFVIVTAAFLVAGAQVAFGVVGPTGPAASVGATGAQQSTVVCPEPRLAGLPPRPKFTNATIHFKLLNMSQGSGYLVRAGKAEVLAGGADQNGTIKNSFLLPDQGVKSRTIPIEVVVANDQCENSPWKLVKKIQYKAVPQAATPTPGNAKAPAAAQPNTPAPKKPAVATPVAPVKPVTPVKPVKPLSNLPKLPPKGPSLKVRAWMNPLDGGSRLVQVPLGPKLSRTERRADKANSSSALIGLGGLFLACGLGAIVGLALLKRKDEIVIADAFGVLPQHLEEGSPDMPDEVHAGEEPDTEQLSAHILQTVPAAAPIEPAAVDPEGNGNGSPTVHREEVEAELQRLLAEAGLDTQLEGILSDARELAAEQGLALDSDVILQAICDELNGTAALSESKRSDLRTMFKDIIAEEAREAEHVSEPAS